MFGLILALVYVAYSVVVCKVNVAVAVASTFSFLWYWHVAWASIAAIVAVTIFILGLCVSAGGDDTDKRVAGLMASFLLSPLIAFLCAIRYGLFLGGVYIMSLAVPAENFGFENWNLTYLAIGAIMYAVPAFFWKVSFKSSSKD